MPKAIAPTTNLVTEFPELAGQWHPTKNAKGPEEYTPKSGKKVWWKCPKGHEWEAVIGNRSQGSTGCPCCSGRQPTKDCNLATEFPKLAREWHPTKNAKGPEEYTPKSNKKVWWLCPEGHEWQAVVNSRSERAQGCPYCSGRCSTEDRNLATEFPELAGQWHPTKNAKGPEEYTPKSNKKVWWLCPNGHEWEAVVNGRAAGKGCPCCSGRQPAKDYNFATEHPGPTKEWHPTKNDRPPEEFAPKSGLYAWWRCSKGHEWQTIIANRSDKGTGCPKCSLKGTSKAEQAIYEFVFSIDPEALHRDRSLGFEVDIYIPSRKLAIEYCGLYWHSTRFRRGKDKFHIRDKYRACEALGVRLITILEDEWLTRPEVVKSRLAHALGSPGRVLYARKLEIRPIPPKDARGFCHQHHLQGRGTAKAAYGLFEGEDLVSAMTFSQGSKAKGGHKHWEINRFCSLPGLSIVGGASRLHKAFLRDYDPDYIISFCDLRWGTGEVYAQLGYSSSVQTAPNYWYVDGERRVHRFRYRRDELRRIFNMDAGTELEISEANGLYRLYDCGNLRFERNPNEPPQ